jgi:hypothetical protein
MASTESVAPAMLFPLGTATNVPKPPAGPAPSKQALQAALKEVRLEIVEIRALLEKLLAG